MTATHRASVVVSFCLFLVGCTKADPNPTAADGKPAADSKPAETAVVAKPEPKLADAKLAVNGTHLYRPNAAGTPQGGISVDFYIDALVTNEGSEPVAFEKLTGAFFPAGGEPVTVTAASTTGKQTIAPKATKTFSFNTGGRAFELVKTNYQNLKFRLTFHEKEQDGTTVTFETKLPDFEILQLKLETPTPLSFTRLP